jgi:hypothetical protein
MSYAGKEVALHPFLKLNNIVRAGMFHAPETGLLWHSRYRESDTPAYRVQTTNYPFLESCGGRCTDAP